MSRLAPILVTLFALLPTHRTPAAPPDDLDRTSILGQRPDARRKTAYESVSTAEHPLVGLELGIGGQGNLTQVAAFRPLYLEKDDAQKPAGLFQDATVNGRKLKSKVTKVVKVVAKDGYAVSGLYVRGGLWISAIQVQFARRQGDALDLKDTYQSEWHGAVNGTGGSLIESDGRPVIGLVGTADDTHAMGIGLVYPKKAVEPPVFSGKLEPAKTPTPKVAEPKPRPTEPKASPASPSVQAPKPLPPREIEPDAKSRIEKQSEAAKKQFEQLAADAKKQQAALNQAFANLPKGDGPPADQEAAREVWRKALDEAEAQPNLNEAQRQEIAQFRKVLGLERGLSIWAMLAIGFTVACAVGTIAMVTVQFLRGPRPHADGNSDDTPSDNKIGGDIPNQYLQPILQELTPNEELLWTGLQSPRVLWKGDMIGTAVTGGMAVLLGAVSLFPLLSRSSPATTPGIVFLAFGLAMAVFSVFMFLNSKHSDKHTVYAVTNRRALVCRPTLFGEGQVDSYGPQVLQGMRRRDYWFTNGAGDLIFRTERRLQVHTQSSRHGSSTSVRETEKRFGFLGIDNVREVEKLVREKLVNPLVDKLLV